MSESDEGWEEDSPERLFVITRGRTRSSQETGLDLVTLIVARAEPQPRMQPEYADILRLCDNPISVAEISANLRLPVSVVTVLLSDLLEDERVEARRPTPPTRLPDPALVDEVIRGLQQRI